MRCLLYKRRVSIGNGLELIRSIATVSKLKSEEAGVRRGERDTILQHTSVQRVGSAGLCMKESLIVGPIVPQSMRDYDFAFDEVWFRKPSDKIICGREFRQWLVVIFPPKSQRSYRTGVPRPECNHWQGEWRSFRSSTYCSQPSTSQSHP